MSLLPNKKPTADEPGRVLRSLGWLGLSAMLALEMEGRSGFGDDALEIGDFFRVQIVIDGGELVVGPLDGGFDMFLVDLGLAERAVG